MTEVSRQQTTRDTVLGGRINLVQPKTGYRAAIDPVLLSASVNLSPGNRILDAGCGIGTALFCALSRQTQASGVGIDVQADLIGLADQGLKANALEDRATVHQGDISVWSKNIAKPYDVVVTNPPYFELGSVPPMPARGQSHMESDVDLKQWILGCLKCLRPKGQFAIIHRAERLSEIISVLNGRTGAVTIHPLWPKQGRPAKRVIVTAVKGRKSPSELLPGLVLHNDSGEYTDAANSILKGGASL